MRLFIAAGMPEVDREHIIRETETIRNSRCVKAVAPEAMHVTLCFLGEREEQEKESIIQTMKQSIRGIGPIEVSYRGLHGFPSPQRPRVVVVPFVQGVEQLGRIYYFLHDQLLNGQARTFSPHITVGRVRGEYRQAADLIAPQHFRENPKGTYTIGRITLYQSILKPEGAQYRDLCNLELQEQEI